jgi:hypothetical protein
MRANLFPAAAAAILALAGANLVQAQTQDSRDLKGTIQDDAKRVGQAVQSGAHDVAEKSKEAGHAIEHGAHEVADKSRDVGHSVANGAKTAGTAIREDSKKAGQAVAHGAQTVGKSVKGGAEKAKSAVSGKSNESPPATDSPPKS